MPKSVRQFLTLMTIALAVAPQAHAAPPPVSPDAVDAAIEKGKAFLYSHRTGDTWEKRTNAPTDAEMHRGPFGTNSGQWGGLTALSCYALLAAGESPQGAKLAPAIQWVRQAPIKGNYALAMRAQLYRYLPASPAIRHAAEADERLFQQALSTGGNNSGLYDYFTTNKFTRFDHSVSQLCVLAMSSCEQAGAEVPGKYWQAVESAWVRDQDGGGGWCYGKAPNDHYPVTAAMTAAGVATLQLTQNYLHPDAGVKCVGNIQNPHVDAGLKWLADNFNRIFTDKVQYAPYYGLYGVSRIGLTSGFKYFGTVDWYRTGAVYLLKEQANDGSWGSLADTCFAILFLSRGRAPIVFDKFQYDDGSKPGNWNERPRDAANATRFISQSLERELNWQIVDLHAEARELHDAPILLITGNQALRFTPQQEAKLRQYCQEGGIILANADGGSLAFAASYRKLAKRLFPDYLFRPLPPGSPIFRAEQFPAARWKQPINVLSLGNGVREMMLLLPDGDAAKWWQLNDSEKIASFQFIDDLFLYAVDKQNLLERGKTFLVEADAAKTAGHTVRVARLQYDGNWNPEPAGWPRLANICHNTADLDLVTTPVELGDAKLVGFEVAHLTGTTKFDLTPVQQAALKSFVIGGGTLIVDAAGGSAAFADSAEQQLTAVFGETVTAELKSPLPPTAPLYMLPGHVIETFGYRPYARSLLGTLKGPQLRVIEIAGRPAVYFSRLDLSTALVGQPVDGILGYNPETAAAIMRNLIVFSAANTFERQ